MDIVTGKGAGAQMARNIAETGGQEMYTDQGQDHVAAEDLVAKETAWMTSVDLPTNIVARRTDTKMVIEKIGIVGIVTMRNSSEDLRRLN
jgi:hypothetical protein